MARSTASLEPARSGLVGSQTVRWTFVGCRVSEQQSLEARVARIWTWFQAQGRRMKKARLIRVFAVEQANPWPGLDDQVWRDRSNDSP